LRPTSFSVVVTSYNYRQFIVEAVEGALRQTRAAAQVVVVDDGSTDGSVELLRERYGDDARVVLVCGKNGGQLHAFGRGVAVATGDVVCFLDADDCWQPTYLEQVGQVYDSRSDVDFVFSDLQLFGEETRWMGFAKQAADLGYTAISTYLLTHWYGAPTSALSMRARWARETLELPDYFRSRWRLSADNCLVFGSSILGARKYYLPTGAVRYRIHGNNGWWSNRNPKTEYFNKLASTSLIRHYASKIGLGPECVELAKLEYMTKPQPSWDEAKRYAALVMMRRAMPWRKWERALSILMRSLKANRKARP
jgi:glycosyltransferase involved in cell wall biosynthesis